MGRNEKFFILPGGGTLIFDPKLIFVHTISKILRLRRAYCKNIVTDIDFMSFQVVLRTDQNINLNLLTFKGIYRTWKTP